MSRSAQTAVGDAQESFGDELPPGTALCGGQYVIQGFLNSGGFGITYLADDSLGRKVVIKECFPGAMCYRQNQTVRLRSKGSEEDYQKILELFEKEALALAELEHPYIVGVHQIFKDNGTAYMALDFIEGRDLQQIIEEEPDRLTPEDVRQLLMKLLDAVAYIHERDILHRDISPDNILIEADNSPVLIDFGAARESATRVSRVLSKVLTVKDGYSPQEFYLAGTKHEYSSDLYALAATFHHLVSGKPPASSQLRLAAAAKNMQDPLEPLGSTIRGYDKHFLDAITTCLNIFPAERLKSAKHWNDLIDVERRRQILKQRAANDRKLSKTISRLVQDSFRDLGANPTKDLANSTKLRGRAKPAAAKNDPKPQAKRRKMTLDELIESEERASRKGKVNGRQSVEPLPVDPGPALEKVEVEAIPDQSVKRRTRGWLLSKDRGLLSNIYSRSKNQRNEVRE